MNSVNFKANVSGSAAAAVRLNFNPSSDDRVQRIKALTAALITECEQIREEGSGSREASIAITEFETAAMWAVKAATAKEPS